MVIYFGIGFLYPVLLGDRLPAQAGLMVGGLCGVYIIKSSVKRWYYVGSTNRIEVRLKEHNTGKVLSTKAFKPFCLIFQKGFEFEKEARAYEKLLKTKRTEKEKIIRLFENKNN